ncbi:MAG: hypothetical protein GC131_06295 [Alphaproteobacteria bacterium]|nr:hypothetical protein [Alphaproteobacteria bacterium]
MHAIAPDVQRQRLLVEGYYTDAMDEVRVRGFFSAFTQAMQLRTYGAPVIFSPGGEGKADNQGYDAFQPLIDSGISLYVWTGPKFFSAVIYTCKSFDAERAAALIMDFFGADEIHTHDF